MKKYFNNVTGEMFTIEELRKAFADAEIEKQTFEDWFDEEIRKGKHGMDGLEEIDDEDDNIRRAADIIAEGNFEVAVNLMDDEIREQVHAELAPCSELEFLTAYMAEHEKKFGEEFTI